MQIADKVEPRTFGTTVVLKPDGTVIDATGYTYTAPSDGIVVILLRIGKNSTADVKYNDVLISQAFLGAMTSATVAGSCPIFPLPKIDVKKGDALHIYRSYGSYLWFCGMYFTPYV